MKARRKKTKRKAVLKEPIASDSRDKAKLRDKPTPRNNAASREAPNTAGSPKPLKQDILLLGLKVGILLAVFGVLFLFVFGIARGHDLSMSPAIKDGDLAVYYRLDKQYRQNDVVVYEAEEETEIRRVVAIAGDTVDITENGLVVNGALQQESSIYEKTQRYEEGIDFPVTLQEGEVFLLGDGREHSTDSRIYGPADSRDIKGKVIITIRRRGI